MVMLSDIEETRNSYQQRSKKYHNGIRISPTRTVPSPAFADVSEPPPNASSATPSNFPSRRPIQRSLFASEEDMIPITDLITKAESPPTGPLSSDPVSAFHIATGYAYTHLMNEEPLAFDEHPQMIHELVVSDQQQYVEASMSGSLVQTLRNAVHVLYRSVLVKGSWFTCGRSGAHIGVVTEGVQEEAERGLNAGHLNKLQVKESRTTVLDTTLSKVYSTPRTLDRGRVLKSTTAFGFPPLASSTGSSDSESEEEEEEEVYSLLKYGIYPPPAQSTDSLSTQSIIPDDLTYWQIESFPSPNYSNSSPSVEGSGLSTPSGRLNRGLSWDRLYTGEKPASPQTGPTVLPRLSFSGDHTQAGSQQY